MNISDIKAAVDAARERQDRILHACPMNEPCPFCESGNITAFDYKAVCNNCGAREGAGADWDTRPAQDRADAALIALWEMMQPAQSDVPFRGMVAKPVETGWEVSLFESGGKVWEFELGSEKESTDAVEL
jgi:hypothetical protein